MLRSLLVCAIALGTATPGPAASSADALFAELSKDFGSVAHGPTLTHAFHLTNKTSRTVHIAGVRTSCACVRVRPLQMTLDPGAEADLEVEMETARFAGLKKVTIFVQFDRPSAEEVRLWVQAHSRDDVTVLPSSLDLGRVRRGQAPAASVTVTLLGNAEWQIVEAIPDQAVVETTVQELRRAGTESSYRLTARLRPDTPPGRLFTDVWLRTNNEALPRIRVPLRAVVESALSVSPDEVVFAQVPAGVAAERRVIVHGVKPFRITAVQETDAELDAQPTFAESRTIHVLTVTLKTDRPGEFRRSLRVVTDLPEDGTIDFQVRAQVLPPK